MKNCIRSGLRWTLLDLPLFFLTAQPSFRLADGLSIMAGTLSGVYNSSTRAELAAVIACLPKPGAIHIALDNRSVVDIAKEPYNTTALKHVKRRHFFVREAQENGELICCPVGTSANVSDFLTKVLPVPRFRHLVAQCLRGFG